MLRKGKGMEVRALKYDDLEQVIEMDEVSGFCLEQWVKALENEDDNDYSYGIFDGDRLVGYCTIGIADDAVSIIENDPDYVSDHSLMLSDVYIDADYRHRMVGLQLLAEALNMRVEDETVYLEMRYNKLYDFYRKVGFEPVKSHVLKRVMRKDSILTKTLYAVCQANHGHDYMWIFDEETLRKEVEERIGSFPDEDEEQWIDMFWPIGGSNTSPTMFRKLNNLKEVYDCLVHECPGREWEDPLVGDIMDYLRTVDTDDGSITQELLDMMGLRAADLTMTDEERVNELKSLGYTEEELWGDYINYRYSEAKEEKKGA